MILFVIGIVRDQAKGHDSHIDVEQTSPEIIVEKPHVPYYKANIALNKQDDDPREGNIAWQYEPHKIGFRGVLLENRVTDNSESNNNGTNDDIEYLENRCELSFIFVLFFILAFFLLL